ncbi:hypothetical protein HDU97_009357, partial [Phlyctochytrium planicorne]
MAEVGKKKCRVLLDNGATQNFISNQIIQQFRLRTELADVLTTVGDTSTVPTSRVKRNLKYQLGTQVEEGDFVVMETMNYDMILGSPWFQWRKPRVNYEKKTVSYQTSDGKQSLSFATAGNPFYELNLLIGSKEELEAELKTEGTRIFEVHLRPFENLQQQNVMDGERANIPKDPEIAHMVQVEFASVFQDEIQTGVPPDRPNGEHIIPLKPDARPINRPMYPLSTAEQDELHKQLKE